MWEDIVASFQLDALSIFDWGLLGTSVATSGLAIWGLVKSAPVRNHLEIAMDAALSEFEKEDDDVSVNVKGDLRKIALRDSTTASGWRLAAQRYINFIDKTNGRLLRLIVWDFARFTAGTWILATIASLAFLQFLGRQIDETQSANLASFIYDMNYNSVAQYFNQPFREVDLLTSTRVDILVTFPYAWILGIIGIPAVFSFGTKLFMNRHPKWKKTRKFLNGLTSIDDDKELQERLDEFRHDKDSDYYSPWFTCLLEFAAVADRYEKLSRKRA